MLIFAFSLLSATTVRPKMTPRATMTASNAAKPVSVLVNACIYQNHRHDGLCPSQQRNSQRIDGEIVPVCLLSAKLHGVIAVDAGAFGVLALLALGNQHFQRNKEQDDTASNLEGSLCEVQIAEYPGVI